MVTAKTGGGGGNEAYPDPSQLMGCLCDIGSASPILLFSLQVIVGDSLSVAPPSIIAGLKGFGTSLASGVDVDNNEYYGMVM